MKEARKIIFAVYCDSDEQARAVQNIAKEFCSNFTIDAVDIMSIYPMIKDNKAMLKQTAKAITKGGKTEALRMIPQLIKMFIK